jgi:hypothetical protein
MAAKPIFTVSSSVPRSCLLTKKPGPCLRNSGRRLITLRHLPRAWGLSWLAATLHCKSSSEERNPSAECLASFRPGRVASTLALWTRFTTAWVSEQNTNQPRATKAVRLSNSVSGRKFDLYFSSLPLSIEARFYELVHKLSIRVPRG